MINDRGYSLVNVYVLTKPDLSTEEPDRPMHLVIYQTPMITGMLFGSYAVVPIDCHSIDNLKKTTTMHES